MTPFSICIEAIRNPRVEQFDYHFSGGGVLLIFEVCLDHGRKVSDRPAGTLPSLISSKGRLEEVKKCEVVTSASLG